MKNHAEIEAIHLDRLFRDEERFEIDDNPTKT